MALVEVKRCRDINCKYISTERVCPDDWFDDELMAECTNPNTKGEPIISEKTGEIIFYSKSLGCDRESDFLQIPEWCPLRKDLN